MSHAVCFNCAARKDGALVKCTACGTTPQKENDLILSLVLCDQVSTPEQLNECAKAVQGYRNFPLPQNVVIRLPIPESHYERAREALKDPQLRALAASAPTQDNAAARGESQRPEQPVYSNEKKARVVAALLKSPFRVLGASTRDNRVRLVELAEEKALDGDHDLCQKARADLTNPRTRLSAEIGWLPGVSPKKSAALIEKLLADPGSLRDETGLPVLAHLNLLATAFAAIDADDQPDDIAIFIQELAFQAEDLSASDVLRDINEDRIASGFPEIKSVDQIEAELVERKRGYRDAIKDAVNRLPPDALVATMTEVVDSATGNGSDHAPALVDELVDSYAIETLSFLETEAAKAQSLIETIRSTAPKGEHAVKPYVDRLETVTRGWDKVAQPIQLSAKARGIDHDPSNHLAFSVRKLAVDLFNEHDMLGHSQSLTRLLKELFAEVPEVSERVEQDVDALSNISRERKKAEKEQQEWEREITYSAEVGVLFKDALSISPQGVAWNDQRYPLDKVTRVRWGGVRHSINGIPTGTTYTIAFGDNLSQAEFTLRNEQTYSSFIDKLWRGVCVRLLTEMIFALGKGQELPFGEAVLRDDGITLVKHKVFGANEAVRCSWAQTHIWNAGGSFFIGAKDDKKTYVELSYIHTSNTHVLEHAIRMAFKKPGMKKLSDILK